MIKSRDTRRPKSRCQSDLSTVSVLANKNLHQDLMHSGCRGTAVPNVCLQAFTLSLVPRWTKGLFTGYPSGTPRSTGLSLRYFAQIRFKTSQTSRRKSYVFKLPQKYLMVYRVERLGDIEK